jgi:malonyl-CoA/methylmalonyl-CoA synthetase
VPRLPVNFRSIIYYARSVGAYLVSDPLFPPLLDPPPGEAIRFGDRSLTYRELRDAAASLAQRIEGTPRVAVWAEPSVETCVAIVGALCAGAAVVPINPKIGERELAHILTDSAPGLLLAAPDPLPPGLTSLECLDIDLGARGAELPAEPDPEAPALILYTSGTTGMPKGVLHARRAITTNLDALAEVWDWSAADVLVHGLPLFHVHGLVLGSLGPIRLGGRLHHVGRFSPEAVAAALAQGGTMLFGVPTMYHRLAEAAEQDGTVAKALAGARLLVSGSAPLPVREHQRIERASGQRVVERYGLTETMMNCSIHVLGDRRPGYVGLPLPGVAVRLLADDRTPLDVRDDETIGEVAVRGPNLFLGYLNRPDATEAAFHDGWFLTGDLATRSADGYIRIVGRRATDLIKTGGFKVGAGEVEAALLEHPAVAEAAVKGEPDDDLGERIVAWVVTRAGDHPSPDDLADHVAQLLAAHKRPREIRFLDELPRNEMGKVRKAALQR